MRLRQISQHFGKEFESDHETVQRIFVEIVAALEDIFEDLAILLEVAQQQALSYRSC